MESREASTLGPNVDLDRCGICLDNFDKPKILPCFHTFCMKCLKSYFEKTGRNGKISCPLCLKETNLPNGGVEKFQTNFYVKAEESKVLALSNAKCDVCEVDILSKADNRCLECDQNLCQNCSKSHLKMTSSKEHHLIPINLPEKPTSPRVITRVYCDKHKNDELSLYCQACDVPLCLRCKVTGHESHTCQDLADVAEQTRQFLGKKLSEAKEFIPKLHEQMSDVNRYENQLAASKQEIVNTIGKRANNLHERVDKISNSMINDIESEFRVEMQRVNSKRKSLGNLGKSLSSQFHAANQVVFYGSDADIAKSKQSLSKHLEGLGKRSEEQGIVRLVLDFSPNNALELDEKIKEMFGSLSTTRPPTDDVTLTEISVFQVDDTFKVVSSICPRNGGEAWLTSGWNSEVHLFNSRGSKLKTQNAGRNIDTIVLNKTVDVIFSCSDEKQILMGKDVNELSTTVNLAMHPRGIAVTSNGDIIVCAGESPAFQDYKEEHKNKVFRYSKDWKFLGEFGDDSCEFFYPLRVVCNITDDVVISDSQKRRITIHRQDGRIKAGYSGTEDASLKSPFEPRGVACDSRGCIFVADNANDTIHLLDHNGKFIKMILTPQNEIYGPYSLAFDTRDNLWVGGKDATVKVFRCTYA